MKSAFTAILTLLIIVQSHFILSQQRDSTLSVFAEVLDDDTRCLVTWNYPFSVLEMTFDDGEADDYYLWQYPGNINAVKFTPTFYPAYIAGGRIYVGDSSFPGPFLGTGFRVEIYDDDGANGMPGTLLDSMTVQVDNYGWVWFNFMSPLCGIEQGSFYMGMVQTLPAPDAAPIGIDTDIPTYNQSYSYYQGTWAVSSYQDFMIRASMTGYSIPEPEIDEYEVARFSNFDPNGSPLDGDTAVLDTTIQLHYNDYDWAGLPQGYYAYGVKSHYASGEWSDYFVSDVVGHLMTFSTYINVNVCDTTFDAFVTVEGPGYYEEFYLSPGGAILLEDIVEGDYHVTIYCPGNYDYDEFLWISPAFVYNIILSCWMFPVENLAFEPVTGMTCWDVPRVLKLKEYFESDQFPPSGWQSESQGDGWFRTADGSGGGWNIPGWDSHYSCSNDLINGSGNDGSMDYLITPLMRLDYRYDYKLHFDSYFDGSNGEIATIEYSYDSGEDWDYLYTVPPSDDWEHIVLDLSPFSGNDYDPFMFAFHADDAGQDASGWAVDKVEIYSPEPPTTIQDYYVFLNDSLVAITDTNMVFLDDLELGENYELCVAAHYPSGLSLKECLSFTYTATKEWHHDQDFLIFPNPAREFIQVRSDFLIITLRIYDPLGKLIKEIIPDLSTSDIDIRDLHNGIYFLAIQTDKGNFPGKLIICH